MVTFEPLGMGTVILSPAEFTALRVVSSAAILGIGGTLCTLYEETKDGGMKLFSLTGGNILRVSQKQLQW